MLANQKGFTLIEIIAVLIILGILAAVALPRYFSIQDDARNAALDAASSSGLANVHQAYMKFLLNGGSNASVVGDKIHGTGANDVNIPTDLGDFTAAYNGAAGDSDCTVNISGDSSKGTAWATGHARAIRTTRCPWSTN